MMLGRAQQVPIEMITWHSANAYQVSYDMPLPPPAEANGAVGASSDQSGDANLHAASALPTASVSFLLPFIVRGYSKPRTFSERFWAMVDRGSTHIPWGCGRYHGNLRVPEQQIYDLPMPHQPVLGKDRHAQH